jgi:hypothetical protein
MSSRHVVVARLGILRRLLAGAYSFTTNGRDHGGFVMPPRSFTAALAAAILAGLFAFAAPARAVSGCASAVIRDWNTGHLDASYAPACYREALSELPEDIRIYSSAENDINRALIASLAKKSTPTGKTKLGAVKGIVRTLATAEGANGVQARAAQAAADPSASAVPVVVLVFAVGALALVSAASISVVARRVRRAR